jgi:hypothetical protein
VRDDRYEVRHRQLRGGIVTLVVIAGLAHPRLIIALPLGIVAVLLAVGDIALSVAEHRARDSAEQSATSSASGRRQTRRALTVIFIASAVACVLTRGNMSIALLAIAIGALLGTVLLAELNKRS